MNFRQPPVTHIHRGKPGRLQRTDRLGLECVFKLVASFSETRTPGLERISRVCCAFCSHSNYARCILGVLKGLVYHKLDWRILLLNRSELQYQPMEEGVTTYS